MGTKGMNCQKCGLRNLMGDRYCAKCGHPLPSATSSKTVITVMAVVGGLALLGVLSQAVREPERNNLAPSPSPVAFAPVSTPTPMTPAQRKEHELRTREALQVEYVQLLELGNPDLNFIQSKLTKMKGGYALWGVHDYFSQFSFSIGPDGKLVEEWVGNNREKLLEAGIVRVGVMGRGGYSSWAYFDVR